MRRRQLRGAARPPTLTAHAGEAGATGNEGTESGAGHSYSSSEASVATSAKTEGKEKGKGLVEEGVERLPFELTRNQSKCEVFVFLPRGRLGWNRGDLQEGWGRIKRVNGWTACPCSTRSVFTEGGGGGGRQRAGGRASVATVRPFSIMLSSDQKLASVESVAPVIQRWSSSNNANFYQPRWCVCLCVLTTRR